MSKLLQSAVAGFVLATASAHASTEPIIDMHLHASAADSQGSPPVAVCAPYVDMPIRDPRWSTNEYAVQVFKHPPCDNPLWSSTNDTQLRVDTLNELERLNIFAVTSGEDPAVVEVWRKAAPRRIVPAAAFGLPDAKAITALRQLHKAGRLSVIGEIGVQYSGVSPADPRMEPYWALAEELDVPVAIHIGPGPPGAAYLGLPKYRMALSDPLLLEDVLIRHPKMRLYVMHAGWPNVDHMIALMYAHPQVYVDTAVIDFTQPRPEFYRYLRRLVEAGYGKRIMFGSDNMVWPGAIQPGIDAIQSADFLSPAQKRDIFYNNAARFLRIDPSSGVSPTVR